MNSITQKNGKTKQTDYVLTPMLDELVRNVEFLGENVWFPSGAITILGGRKRCGKSTLALYECARFSAMGKKVLIVQREDDAGLVKAKLQCMGADLGNIMLYKRRAGGIEYCGFNAGDLRGIVESAGKMHADLVYIDPLHGLAAGRMNDQQSADCLIALDAMAKRNNCCVLGVLHAKKDPEDVSYAISGSDQWVAKARSYLYLETCPNASDVADDTAQDYLDLKNVMKEDRTDPVVREAMAEWMHAAVHLNGNHMLTRELFHQAESKDRRWTPAKLRKAFSLAGLGQARAAERGSRSIVYLKDPSEYSGEEAERLDMGSTPETLAKEWVATVPR